MESSKNNGHVISKNRHSRRTGRARAGKTEFQKSGYQAANSEQSFTCVRLPNNSLAKLNDPFRITRQFSAHVFRLVRVYFKMQIRLSTRAASCTHTFSLLG